MAQSDPHSQEPTSQPNLLEEEPRTFQQQRWDENFAKLALRYAGGSDAQVLCLPCGSGRYFETLHPRVKELRLFDTSPATLEALLKAHPEAKSCEPLVCAVDAIPLPDASVDLALCMHHFHRLPDPADRLRTLKELARVSRRYVAISVHDRATLSYIRKRIRSEKPLEDSLRLATIMKEAAAADLRLKLKHPTLSLFEYQRSLLFEKTSGLALEHAASHEVVQTTGHALDPV